MNEDGPTEAGILAGEAYQVIGDLALAANLYDHREVQRALDWFSGFEPGITYKDDASILPWPKEELKPDDYSALPRASGVPEAEAVAWQWRFKDKENPNWGNWNEGRIRTWVAEDGGFDAEERQLYASPPPVAAPSGEAEINRLREALSFYTNPKLFEGGLDWSKRAADALAASPIASEPKDAEIPWDQRPAHPMAAWKEGLPLGLYRIHWKDEGTALAAIGMKSDGRRWIAATNWVSPCEDPMHELWTNIERAEPIIPSEPKDAGSAADAAYHERNQVVAALARCFPSGVKKTAIEGWDTAWHNCVYIDLPTGQASWHYHDDDTALFEDLPPYKGVWDGHSTPEKYERLARLKDAGSGEGQEMSDAEQERVLIEAMYEDGTYARSALHTLVELNCAGYRIVRTAPSGAKLGEVR
jgi:hypothetical protein